MNTQLKGNVLNKLGDWGSLQSSHTCQELRLMTTDILGDVSAEGMAGWIVQG
jgi:hypothetical protein